MGIKVGLVGVFISTEGRRLDQILQDALHADVEVRLFQRTTLHLVDKVIDLRLVARLHQVVAGLNLCSSIAQARPVGHHYAVVAPLITQDGGEQLTVLLGIRSVDAVVRRHHGPGSSLAHSNLEALQVNLAEGSLRHHLVDVHAVGLLRVTCEVLHRCAHTLTLHASHIGSSDLTRHNRVFRVVFEVTSTERRTMDIHTWSKQHVATIFQYLIAYALAHLLHELRVPGAGECRTYRKSCAEVGILVVLTTRADSHAGRAVSEHSRGDAEARNGLRHTSSTRHATGMGAYHAIVGRRSYLAVAAYYEHCFLLERHRFEDFINVAGLQFHLCRKGAEATQQDGTER